MVKKYFLASNSANGFFSLYGSFPPDGAYLHVIKGGPGTGKSSFMRSLGKRAEEMGYEAEYVLCSGDPASLDGVYIPALKTAWSDGTAPHTAEPRLFGVDADYVNLGQFCRTPLSADDAAEAARLNAVNKGEYAKAYKLLSEAGAAREHKSVCSPARRIFLSAISRDGRVSLYEALADFKTLTASYDELGDMISAHKSSSECIICLDPLLPDRAEALILPNCRTVIRAKAEGGASDALIAQACEHIRAAGLAHDELERIYKKYMDYDALNEFTEAYSEKLFDIM